MIGAKPIDELCASPLDREQLPTMRKALEAAGLPADDLDALFAFAQGDVVVGYGGLEVYGEAALVRSIVVESSYRRQGIGRKILERVLETAKSFRGLARLSPHNRRAALFRRPRLRSH